MMVSPTAPDAHAKKKLYTTPSTPMSRSMRVPQMTREKMSRP